jgi:hypothetical protein
MVRPTIHSVGRAIADAPASHVTSAGYGKVRGTMTRILVLAILLAGCGGGSDERAPGEPASGAPIPGGGLSVAEAKASTLDGPLMVAGYLAQRDGRLRLCDGLRESDPPQCVDPSLRVDGDVGDAEVGERASLLGDVDGDVLRVSETAQG